MTAKLLAQLGAVLGCLFTSLFYPNSNWNFTQILHWFDMLYAYM